MEGEGQPLDGVKCQKTGFLAFEYAHIDVKCCNNALVSYLAKISFSHHMNFVGF